MDRFFLYIQLLLLHSLISYLNILNTVWSNSDLGSKYVASGTSLFQTPELRIRIFKEKRWPISLYPTHLGRRSSLLPLRWEPLEPKCWYRSNPRGPALVDETLSLLSMEWLRGTLDCGGMSTLLAAASSWSLSKMLMSCGSSGMEILLPGIREEKPHPPLPCPPIAYLKKGHNHTPTHHIK